MPTDSHGMPLVKAPGRWRRLVRICPTCAADWTLMGSLQKGLLVAAFILGVAGMAHPQIMTEAERQMDVINRRTERLESQWSDVIRLQEKVVSLQESQKKTQESVDSLNNRLLAGIGMGCLAILERVLSAFGLKIRDLSKTP